MPSLFLQEIFKGKKVVVPVGHIAPRLVAARTVIAFIFKALHDAHILATDPDRTDGDALDIYETAVAAVLVLEDCERVQFAMEEPSST